MQSSPCSEERKGRVSPGVMESEIPFDYYWRNKMLANHHLNVNKIISIHFNSAKLLQKSEMRKDIVIELSYKGFS